MSFDKRVDFLTMQAAIKSSIEAVYLTTSLFFPHILSFTHVNKTSTSLPKLFFSRPPKISMLLNAMVICHSSTVLASATGTVH